MIGRLASSGRLEVTLFTGPSCVMLFGELKYEISGDDTKYLAQMLVEAEGTRFAVHMANSARG